MGYIITSKNDKYGLEKNNKNILPHIYDYIEIYKDYKVKIKKNKKYCILELKKVTKHKINQILLYDEIYFTPHKNVNLSVINNKYGIIKDNGDVVIPCIYNGFSVTDKKFIAASLNNKYGVIDFNGKPIIPFMYDTIFINNDIFSVEYKKRFGCIDENNQIIIPLIYEDIGIYLNEVVYAKQQNKYGFVNLKNEVVIPFIYDKVSDFHDNNACVCLNNKWGIIDINGKTIIPPKYDILSGFGFNDITYGYLNKKIYYIDKKNNTFNNINDAIKYKEIYKKIESLNL